MADYPVPEPGLVIRYSYLWKEEAAAGAEEGVKDRPCAVIAAVERVGTRVQVVVLPITHSPPRDPADAIEVPQATKQRLGLDGERSWIVVTEANRFFWTGPDLRPRVAGDPRSVNYGYLPRKLALEARDRFLAAMEQGGAASVPRTE